MKKKAPKHKGRKCLVCLKNCGSNFAVKQHYDTTKCGVIRRHPRFANFVSSSAIGKAIQTWKKTGAVPSNPRSVTKLSVTSRYGAEGVIAALPTQSVTRRIPVRGKMQVNFCPNCGCNLGGVAG